MRFIFHLVLMIGIALLIGFGLSWYSLTDGKFFGAYESGPWIAWPRLGSATPDPYTEAYAARSGALFLGTSEGVQFIATTDGERRPLDRRCSYKISGTTPTATFWTLVPTGASGETVSAPDGPPGFVSNHLARNDDGSVDLYFSPALSPMNWVELAGSGPFSLVLTFYDASLFAGATTSAITLPTITRVAC